MSEYKEVTDTVDIPTHSGVEGFLLALRKVLKMPRLTNVSIDSRGKVTFTRFARAEEPRKNVEIDFDSVSPGALVRNLEIRELDVSSAQSAPVCIAAMFAEASLEHMFPVGFVTGANTVLPEWHLKTSGVKVIQDTLYGFPVYRDRFIPDEALLLVTAFSGDAALVDAQKAYKISMPSRQSPIKPVQELKTVFEFTGQDLPPVIAAAIPSDGQVRDEVEVIRESTN